MSGNHVEIWNNCLSVIKDNVTEEAYKTWFEPIVPVSLENNLFILQVPSPFFAEFLDEHHLNLLKPVIKRFAGEKVKLAYKLPVDSSASNGTMTVPSSNRSVPKNPIGEWLHRNQRRRP